MSVRGPGLLVLGMVGSLGGCSGGASVLDGFAGGFLEQSQIDRGLSDPSMATGSEALDRIVERLAEHR